MAAIVRRMAESVSLTDTIESLAQTARSVTVDGQQVNRRGLQELIAADQYLKKIAAGKTKTRGISFVSLKPPGCGGDR